MRILIFFIPMIEAILTNNMYPNSPEFWTVLDASVQPQDMNLPGYKLHMLSGKEKGAWSVWVTGNWRVTFQFDGPDAVAVDYRDYHK